MHKAVLLGVLLLIAFALPIQAQFAIGGGVTYRGVIMGDLGLRIGNLSLTVDAGGVSDQAQGLTASVGLASALLSWSFPLGFPVTPFIGAGGVAAGIQLAGQQDGQSVSITGTVVGGQFAAGAEFQPLPFPLVLTAAVYYSTASEFTLKLEAGGQAEEFKAPVKGVGGFSFSIGLRYDFISIGGAKPEQEGNPS